MNRDDETLLLDECNPDDIAASKAGVDRKDMAFQKVGRFRIIKPIGAGGMGLVFAGYDEELDRQVAIKLLRHESSNKETDSVAHARMQREAQAMARLNHPNVIQVYEVGMFSEGIFIAMEFVKGVTLSKWLDEKKRSWKEIIDVFVRAGQGLAAAHDVDMVHRDFKPDNVMIGDDGRVRVLDFGLARSAQDEPEERVTTVIKPKIKPERLTYRDLSKLTKDGAIAGTPNYMAPEQYMDRDIGPATDQFSFCVAVWEALFGEHPFRHTEETTTKGAQPEEIEIVPIATSKDIPKYVTTALQRGLSVIPGKRWPTLPALLQALKTDPNALRRKQLLVVGIIVFVAAMVYGFWPEKISCDGGDIKIASVWNDGKKANLETAFIKTNLPYGKKTFQSIARELDSWTDNWATDHRDACEMHAQGVQSDTALDLRTTCLGNQLTELEALLDVFSKADTGVVDKSMRAVQSLEPVERCRDLEALKTRIPPIEDPNTGAEVASIRAELARVKAGRMAGQYKEALKIAEPLLPRSKAVDYQPILAETLFHIGDLQDLQGQPKKALGNLKQAAWMAHAYGDDTLSASAGATVVWVLGTTLAKFERSLDWLEWSKTLITHSGNDERIQIELQNSHGVMLMKNGKHQEAIDVHNANLELSKKVYGKHSILTARVYNNLGNVYLMDSKFARAAERYQKAIDIVTKQAGVEHPMALSIRASIVSTLQKQNRNDEALKLGMQIVGIQERVLGKDHPNIAVSLNNLAISQMEIDDLEGARQSLERAVRIWEKTGDANLADGLQNLGDVYRGMKDYDKARKLVSRCLELYMKDLGPDHGWNAWPLDALGTVELDAGRLDVAQGYFNRCKKLAAEKLGPRHEKVGDAEAGLGLVLAARGNHKGAIAQFEKAHSILVEVYSETFPVIGSNLYNKAVSKNAMGQMDEALEDVSKALTLLTNRRTRCDAFDLKSKILSAQGDNDSAVETLKAAKSESCKTI